MKPKAPVQSLEGVWNLRDLGDRPVMTGGRTRSRRMYRSGTLWFATMPDCTVLAEYGFDTVIDLRLLQEERREEDWLCELLDTRYHHLPIEVPDDRADIALAHPGGAEHYVRLLDHNAARYVRALEIVSEPDSQPILFHCAAGLDRTGVLAALVLACLDVEEAAIVADYVESEAGLRRIVDAYRNHPFYGDVARAARGHQVDGAVMEQFLDHLGGRAGLQKWAAANGLDDSALERMRDALVQP